MATGPTPNPMVGIPLKENTNHDAGRTGSETPQRPGPARGSVSGNETQGGGINRATKSGNAPRS